MIIKGYQVTTHRGASIGEKGTGYSLFGVPGGYSSDRYYEQESEEVPILLAEGIYPAYSQYDDILLYNTQAPDRGLHLDEAIGLQLAQVLAWDDPRVPDLDALQDARELVEAPTA